MTTETRKRIRAYKKALPELRERVVAVALLLAMSVSMLASASFAWLTISRNPEVSGATTTVAANGNLEIALATGNDKPDESKVGDSSAAEGQSVTAANVTWGNLINLSDPSYGLDNLTLRPAQLNKSSLLTSPLFGAVYTADGRVERLTSNFSYTSWVPAEGTTPGYFGMAQDLGVRAISSTKVQAHGYLGTYLSLKDAASSANAVAAGAYRDITSNEAWMTALANVMGIHMTATLNSEDQYVNAVVSPEDLEALITMYGELIETFKKEAQAMADLLNLELYAAYGGDTTKYQAWSKDSVLAATIASGNDYIAAKVPQADGTEKIVKISNFKTFINDYNMLVSDKVVLEEINSSGDRRWTAGGLKAVVNRLVNINQCKIQFSGENAKTVSDFLSGLSSNPLGALSYRNSECTATLTNGVLYNLDQRVGAGITVTKSNSNGKKGLLITAKMYVSTMNLGEQTATVYATIKTSATDPAEFTQDLRYAESLNTGAGADVGEMSAEDTYGLAIDLWVRTNAEESYLTLEGNVLTKSEEVDAKGKDSNGNEVQLYTVSRTTTDEASGTSITNTYDVYKIEDVTDNGDGTTTVNGTVWYRADTYSVFELQDGENPILKKNTITTVIGFEGENRVWNSNEDKINLSIDATTQGSGSCYVYYADTPEDQARSLELLKALNVAFVDVNGNLLATASMDTTSSYEESGRVIVPLVLNKEDSISLGDGENTQLAIAKLESNVPTRITAIVYLDGTLLTNENVLSASDIQGQLNIQFGSSSEMEPIRNETLELAERKVSASVNKTAFNYDTDTDLTTTVSVLVTGEQPKKVTAFFIRKINDAQGSREQLMTQFVLNEVTGAWECDYTFTAPGEYILRTVELDGQEYTLHTSDSAQLPSVTVKGFSIESLTCTQATGNNINIMTAASSGTVDMKLKFASNDRSKMPNTVQGRFLRDDGTAVNVNFTYNATTNEWVGSATFLVSGDYTLRYLVLNGEYTELPSNFWQSAAVTLGMRVAIYTDGNTSFKYLPSEMADNEKILVMYVRIMDNANKPMTGLQNAKLTYRMTTSSTRVMDTDLTWNASSGYYVGELKSLESGGAGVWKFGNVVVGGNTLTNATTSPTFTMIAPEPPSYAGITNKSNYQFSPEGKTFMQANLKYSSTATALAVIADKSGNLYEVQGTISGTDEATNVSTWHFEVPKNASGKQDGYWTMKEIRVWNYYTASGTWVGADIDADGKLVPDGERDEPMVIDMSGEGYTMKVVETFTARVYNSDGNNTVTYSGTFLETHSVNGVYFTLYDFENQPLENVKEAKLVYDYDGKTQENGGYTSSSVVPTNGYFTLTFAQDSTDKKNFYQEEAKEIVYAGSYIPVEFSFFVGGKSYSYKTGTPEMGGAPTFMVKSTAPSATITGISPTGSNPTKITWEMKDENGCSSDAPYFKAEDNKTSSYTAYAATVYAKATADNSTQHNGSFTRPTVTLTIAGVDSSSTVSLVLPAGSASAVTFSRTGNGTVTGTLGTTGSIKTWTTTYIFTHTLNAYYGHGTQTISTMTITRDGVTYTVTLANPLTITNPSSVNKTS